jgi:hypothetical protein
MVVVATTRDIRLGGAYRAAMPAWRDETVNTTPAIARHHGQYPQTMTNHIFLFFTGVIVSSHAFPKTLEYRQTVSVLNLSQYTRPDPPLHRNMS